MKDTSKTLRIVAALIIGTIVTAVAYYLMLPAINIYNTGFWSFLILVICAYGLPMGVVQGLDHTGKGKKKPQGKVKLSNKITILR